MQKINLSEIPVNEWLSPKGKFGSSDQEVSIALGLDLESNDVRKRHPFDVTISRVRPGVALCPYHSHSAQWEFYTVISGRGRVRDEAGFTDVVAGDSFIFQPGEAHQILNDGPDDLVITIVADNPVGETCYYPDSQKWQVRSPVDRVIRGEAVAYLDGEE
jgi:uncharacterized cupin superfamily protein